MCAAQQLKHYYDPEDVWGDKWELNDQEIAALDLQGAASPIEVKGDLPDIKAKEMAKEGFYMVKSIHRHCYHQGGFGVKEATWESFSAFVLPEGHLNSLLADYPSKKNLIELLRLAETLASQKTTRD